MTDHEIRFLPTDLGEHPLVRVVCLTCNHVVHKATSSPEAQADAHRRVGLCSWEKPKPISPFDRARAEFPVGCKVETNSERPEWSSDIHADRVVCGYARFRDSEDDPIICVCLLSTQRAFAGWFTPAALKRIR